jgi:two-component system, cell cycle sensor histidine kinase and response regulator CckA
MMSRPHPFSLKKADLLWVSVSLLALLPCLYYGYLAGFTRLGFNLDPTTWKVLSAPSCPEGEECLREGDRVLAIGEIEFEEFARDRSIDMLDAFDALGVAPVRVERRGEVRTVRAQLQQDLQSPLRSDVLVAVFPLVFWLMGTVVVIFLRPRDERWLVLVAFSYVTATWFASGLASPRHSGGASVVFHLFIWLFLPLSVHLHLVLPNSLLGRRRWALLAPLYAGSLALVALDSLYLLHRFEYAYVWSFAAGALLSLGLLVVRLFLRADPAVKVANRIMLYGVVLGFGPILLFFFLAPLFIVRLTPFADRGPFVQWALAISLVSIPILPASYIYAIYKHHLGELEFRANRLLGDYSFFSLYITFYVAVLLFASSWWAPADGRGVAITLAISLLFVSVAPFLRNRFQGLVDRHVFGIRHSPEEVIAIVSERIPTAFNRAVLARAIVEEILPTLLIRQSALYVVEASRQETLYAQAVPPDEPEPELAELHALLRRSGRYVHPESPLPGRPWVRLVIPLEIKTETIGVWLMGRRDPDDFYPASDVRLLSTVANQVAPMIENIRLYEQAQQEIAQRKAAEQEIRRSEERFRNLFEAALEGIAIVRNGIILEVNSALLAIFGYAAGELIGRDLSGLVSLGEAGLTGVPREGLGFKRDGSLVDIEVAGKGYVFQGEDVTVVAIRDIARRKRDEAENKMLQQQLLHSQKMEAIGRLSAGVAHDFNNCLLAIFGYSDLLLSRYADDAFLGRNLAGIKEAGQRAAALTKRLLAFARKQPLEAKVMDLNLVVSGVEKMLQRLLGEDVALETDLHPGLARVRIDPGQMEQVVVNLAVNARHAMPAGGRFVLRTSPLPVVAGGAAAAHADVPAGSYVLLTVADTGTGMDAETQARVFEPFFTTKRDGTGLGLSTAYGIVRQSGGHIFVDSKPGEGTRFSIYLPASRAQEMVSKGTSSAAADTGTETILLVEDDEKVRAVLHQILLDKGYRVLVAAAGEEALAAAAHHGEVIHLLLTDVTMPQMKGPELAARLLAARSGLRVLYMSGYNEEPLSGPGAPVCLQKPFSAQVLSQAVRAALELPAAAAG